MRSPLLLPILSLAVGGCAQRNIPPVVLIPQTRLGPADDFGPGIVAANSGSVKFELDRPGEVIVLRVTDNEGIRPMRPLRSQDRTRMQRGMHRVVAEPAAWARVANGSTNPGSGNPYYAECGRRFEPGERPPALPGPTRTAANDSAGRTARQVMAARREYESCVKRERNFRPISRSQATTGARTVEPGYWLIIVSDVPTSTGELRRRLESLALPDTALAAAVPTLPDLIVGGRTRHWAAYYVPFGTRSSQ